MISWLLIIINFNALFFLFLQMSLRHSQFQIDLPVFMHSLWFTVYQAAVSAFFCVIVGLIAAPGYARLGKYRRISRWIFLLPNIVSPILAVLGLILAFKHFPFGFWGIIVGHLFLNGGLCGVWLGERWLEIEERWGPVNEVMGGNPWIFFRRGILPLMKGQIANTFAVVFFPLPGELCRAACFRRWSTKLDFRSADLRTYLFRRRYRFGDLFGDLFNAFCSLPCFLVILRPTLLKTEYQRLPWIKSSLTWWFLPTFVVALFCVAPLGALMRLALAHGALKPLFENADGLRTMKNSLLVALSVTTLSFIILCWAGGWGWSKKIVKAPALSGVAVGLTGLLLFKTWNPVSYTYVMLALIWGHLAVICLPVFRLCAPAVSQLRFKFDNALRQMGVTPLLSLKKVYFKLGLKTYIAGAVLAGCWSMGEFSVSSLISPQAATLPVYIHDLLASYRLEAAAGASLGLLVLSIISMTLFEVLVGGMG